MSKISSASGGHEGPIPSPPAEPNEVDIIAYETVEDSNDDIRTVSEKVLRKALDGAEYGGAGFRTTYGNSAGRRLLEERHDITAMMTRLEGKIDKQQDQIAQQQDQIAQQQDQIAQQQVRITQMEDKIDKQQDQIAQQQVQIAQQQVQIVRQQEQITDLQFEVTGLRHRVTDLTLASEGYRKVRGRFLDVYKRDILENIDGEGYRRINEGNLAAHGGDAVADAELYTSKKRHDEMVLLSLYGLTAAQISCLAKAGQGRIIAALNAGATLKAKGNIPEDVDAAFNALVKEIPGNYDKNARDNTNSLGRACNAFWRVYNQNK